MSEVFNQIVNYPTIPAGGDAGQNLMKKSSADFDADFDLPVLFDETGIERVVGWYKYANGTKKPVYEKVITGYLPSSAKTESYAHNINNVDEFVRIEGIVLWGSHDASTMPVINANSKTTVIFIPSVNSQTLLITVDSNRSTVKFIVTLQYTKSTDTLS